MKVKDKALFLIIFGIVTLFLLYKIRLFIAPFVLSVAVAHLLNPLVIIFINKLKVSRVVASSVIVGVFFVLFIIFCAIFIPFIYSQSIILLNSIPDYLEYFSSNFYPNIVEFFNKINVEIEHDFFDLIKNNQLFTDGAGLLGSFLSKAINSTTFLINILSIIFIMPVLIFYLLKDWNSIIGKVIFFLPKKYSYQAKTVLTLIDKAISGFVRGQINVCIILALYYGILLGLLGLNHGIFIGVLTGILSFVPYIGYGIGITTAIIVAIFQWGFSFFDIGLVVVVYLLGQIIESSFLVPNLIGKKINLHPLWMIFGIFFFGSIFGFLGVVFSVPLTAISASIIRYVFNNKYNQIKND